MDTETQEILLERSLNWQTEAKSQKKIDSDYYVEGYATTFDPYVLFTLKDGTPFYEMVDRHAFDGADMSDVLLQYNHDGPVYARTSNGTMGLEVDDHGLLVYADLSKTSRGRQLYEDIAARNITQMSIKCRADVKQDFDNDKQTITHIKRLFDVSAVSIPANKGTEIFARKADEYKEAQKIDKQKKDRQKKALELKIKLEMEK